MKDSQTFRHGLNERIRVDAFYDGLTYWSVLIRSLAGG
jgi:carboxypeptidase PM20D1